MNRHLHLIIIIIINEIYNKTTWILNLQLKLK